MFVTIFDKEKFKEAVLRYLCLEEGTGIGFVDFESVSDEYRLALLSAMGWKEGEDYLVVYPCLI